MQSVTRLTLLLCSAWAAALLYGEMGAYWAARLSCSWPSSSPPSSPNNHVKIAVVADPQLMDSTSLGLPPSSIALQAAEFYTDLNMRRSFQSVILPFKPDVLLFLGDHFDGGPYMSNEEWHESLSRFKHIFSMNEHITNPNIPIHFLSGNHDIGYSAFHKIHPEVITRYEKEFGLRNYQFSAGKVDFVVVDAQTLDGAKESKERSSSWEFIRTLPSGNKSNPKVLLTHIPLYRPDNSPCGPHRSSPVINQRVSNAAMDQGIIYQNYLSKETSDLLLSLLKPVLVLSGHDHDQCTIVHPTPFGPVTEHTLGTISWQQGNLYPSFMLLSAGSKLPENSTDIEREFVVTILLLVSWPTNGLRSLPYVNAFVSFMGSVAAELFSKTKEKDDEEDGEYEMVWDAEGSMHLVKKAVAKNPSTSSDSRTTGRGSVVARPTARKHQLEPDSSVLVEMSSEMTSEDGAKGSRSSKLKIRRVLQRLFRVIQSIVVIAALNVPLYMMLLFKDWIDR
uniref:Calcineurin-like phosphoesterase domain-containing protein n=1 Tax=Leersia perrieri TaxID=77586 RepID=A0A0D9VUX0_9ORYZ